MSSDWISPLADSFVSFSFLGENVNIYLFVVLVFVVLILVNEFSFSFRLVLVRKKRLFPQQNKHWSLRMGVWAQNQYLSLQTGLVALQVLPRCSLLRQLGPHLIHLLTAETETG